MQIGLKSKHSLKLDIDAILTLSLLAMAWLEGKQVDNNSIVIIDFKFIFTFP